MSGIPKSIELIKIVNALKSLRTSINVPSDFHNQMDRIKKLLNNDKSGIVCSILDFMVHTSTVPMRIETRNEGLNANLKFWQKSILNKNISIDIPRGLRELSTEYYRERLFSSFIALNVKWGKIKFDDGTVFEVPTRMWFVDGANLSVAGKSNGLNTKQYFIGRKPSSGKQLKNTATTSVLIRKPFSSWYETYPIPYLVKRGILFNALLKEAIVTKQSDVIEAIIPYLLLLKSGSDKLAELDQLAGEEELKNLKDIIVKATNEHDVTGNLGKLVASLNYDVDIEHLIPDLTKIFNEDITKAIDKNLLAGLGMIELEGFSGNRQQTILNPKVLVEEIKDAVADWASLLEEVMVEMMERNRRLYPDLTANEIRIVPGKIKAFITDDMRSMFRSLYDRGLFSKQSGIEDIGDSDFEVELERLDKEVKMNLNKRMQPPVIQNLEQYLDPDLQDEDVLDDRKPGTPEADNFNNAILKQFRKNFKKGEKIKTTPFDNVSELPDDIKNVLTISAQNIWLLAFNLATDKATDQDKESLFKIAWSDVEKTYRPPQNNEKKWHKK